MRILLTGASGFLGGEIRDALSPEHEIITLGRDEKNQIRADISRDIPVLPGVDMVIHAAGKAHRMPKTEAEREAFFAVNTFGTRQLLKAFDVAPPKQFVLISSVAVYGRETGENISEKDPLLGTTAYAISKKQAEDLVLDWGKEKGINTLILRLPLITGTNPPGNLAAMHKAIRKGYYFRIGKGSARKSMVAARDIAELLPRLMSCNGIYNLTDGLHPSIHEVDTLIGRQTGARIRSIPEGIIKLAAKLGDKIPGFPLNALRYKKLTADLTFSDTKARKDLGWNPRPALEKLLFSPTFERQ